MKVKTSVTLSEELLRAIDSQLEGDNRSAFIEEAAWSRIRAVSRAQRDRKELEAIDASVESLNAEALEVLDFQDRT